MTFVARLYHGANEVSCSNGIFSFCAIKFLFSNSFLFILFLFRRFHEEMPLTTNTKMSRRKTLCIKLSLALNLCVLLYIAIQSLDGYLNPNEIHQSESVSHQRTLNSINAAININNQAEKLVLNQTLIPTTVTSVTSAPKRPILCYEKDTRPRKAMRGQYWALYNYVPARLKPKCNESLTYTTHCDHTFLDNVVPLLKRWQGPISIALYTPGSDYEDALKAVAYYRWVVFILLKFY